MSQPSTVTVVPAAPSAALAHFEASFTFETDCWDVHEALAGGAPDFVLLDVRGTEKYAAGHVPGARGRAAGPAGPPRQADDRWRHRLA